MPSPIPKIIKTISRAIAAGHPPMPPEAEIAILEDNPDSILALVDALLADMAKPKGITPDVLTAYAWLLSVLLEPLRHGIESGYVWAADRVAAVQERLAQAIREGIGTPGPPGTKSSRPSVMSGFRLPRRCAPPFWAWRMPTQRNLPPPMCGTTPPPCSSQC